MATTKRRRRRLRKATHRFPSPSAVAAYRAQADRYLKQVSEIFKDSANLDTAVRDSISTGLASIVHAAHDCLAWAFIESSTAEWFRTRGFAEWFCAGAANLFCTSRPRILSECIVFPKRAKKKK